MQSFSAQAPANPPYSGQIHPSFADEVSATVARLFAYVGVLMLFAILGLHALDRLQFGLADHSSPAFASSPQDTSNNSEKSDVYLILRQASGDRKDIFPWSGTGEGPAADLEIHRAGATAATSSDWMTDTAIPPLRGAL